MCVCAPLCIIEMFLQGSIHSGGQEPADKRDCWFYRLFSVILLGLERSYSTKTLQLESELAREEEEEEEEGTGSMNGEET